jgi:AraC-like DNA-binding protein
MPTPHKIEARLACRVVEDLRRRGVRADDLLKEVGLRRADVADPEGRIPYAAVLGLIERAATLLGDPSLGLRLGASYEARDSGLLGFVVLNSPTLMDAFRNLQRYFHVVGEGEDIEIERAGPHVVLRFRETDPALRGLRHNSEYMAAIIVRACRDMTRKRLSPARAEFMHGRPNVRVAYDQYLGCPVKFQAEWDALVYNAETTRLPVIGADDKLLKVLQRACSRILGPAPKKKDLVHDVRELVIDRLTKGPIHIDDVASELGMSSKTLERRLAEKKRTFSALLDDIRSNLAKRYLSDTRFRLEQVAYLTGYSEPAALVRAFKRWTGTTPIQYRETWALVSQNAAPIYPADVTEQVNVALCGSAQPMSTFLNVLRASLGTVS